MKPRLLITVCMLSACCWWASAVYAQDATYKFDIGAGLGMSGYLGDVNESNMFRRPGYAVNLSFRYQGDTRWAIRTVLSTVSLSGDSQNYSGVFPDGASYKFKSQVYDLGVRGEFNFFSYGIGETYKRLRRWSPYMAVGVGCSLAGVEGGTYVGLSIPMAFGIKYKIRERWNLSAEFCMTKVLSDNLDSLSDLYGIKSSFLKNNDWHSALTISISYEFGKRCETCHYVD